MLEYCRSTGDKKGEGEALRKLGDTFRASSDFLKALEYLSKARAIAVSIHDEYLLARVYNRISSVYFEMKNTALSEMYADSSFEITTRLHYSDFQSNNLNILGALAMASQDYKKATSYLEQSLALQRETGDTLDLPNAMNNLAHTYLLAGDYNRCEQVARDSYAMADRMQSLSYMHYALLLLYQSSKARANYEDALSYHERYKNITDSLASRKKSEAVAEIETLIAVKDKEHENELLKKESENRTESNRILTWMIAVMAALLVLSLSTLVLLLVSRRQREKAHELLQAEKARADWQNAEIEKQRKALEENNQIRDRLFSVIAHDLRSPLNSLQSILGLMKVGALNEQELRLLLRGLTDRVDSTSILVDNLLNWAKSQLHGFQVNAARMDLSDVARGQTELLMPQAESKNIRLENKVQPPVLVMADQSMVEVIIRNLINNAIKFTPKGGEILLTSVRNGNSVIFSVSDTGVGMSESVKQKLFSGNYFSTMGTSREAGSGLGLMLVKEFTEKNGGFCTVASIEGKGSVFSVTLPAA